ncbi:MAG: hypothetical protein V4717_13730 [Bacteroidota bacterium]
MEGWYNQLYIILLVISNVVALIMLVAAFRWPRVARIMFFVLFGWACWINWRTSQQSPNDYLNYAGLAWMGLYRNFINGWFATHIQQVVGIIATCQGLIAISMLLKAWIFRFGCIGGIVFLLAILPLGIGAGFPATAIMAIALLVLLKRYHDVFVWRRHQHQSI